MNENEISEVDKNIIREILSLEKLNNRAQKYNNQQMAEKIIEILKKGANQDEV